MSRVVLHRDPTTRGSLAGRYRYTDRHGRVWLVIGNLDGSGYTWDVALDTRDPSVDLSTREGRRAFVYSGKICFRLSEVRAWLAEHADAEDPEAVQS